VTVAIVPPGRCNRLRSSTRSKRCAAFRADLPAHSAQIRNDRARRSRWRSPTCSISWGLTVVLVVLVIFLFVRRASATINSRARAAVSIIGVRATSLGYSLDNVSLWR